MNEKELEARLKAYQERLENDEDYAMSDEMQEEYYFFKEAFQEIDDQMISYDPSLKKTFIRLCKDYENPDGVTESTLDMMFPDSDGEYDMDEMDFD